MSGMSEVFLSAEEDYPVYMMVERRWGTPVTIDAATRRRWGRVMRQYGEVQEEMKQALEAALAEVDQVSKG